RPRGLLSTFKRYVVVLWCEKLGQISLAVTTLFWGVGATLQLSVIEGGAQHVGFRLAQCSVWRGITSSGTVIGRSLAGRVPLHRALSVLPMGVLMGLMVLFMLVVKSTWAVYTLLLVIGALSGYFVVPMNALLQHRGHVLLSAGHSIAVQNFNEQSNILLMLGLYSLMLWLDISIYVIIVFFGLLVTTLMLFFIWWNRYNHKINPELPQLIGQ